MLLCWWLTDWSTTTIVLVGLPILVFFSWVALAWSKRLWIAVEYVTDLKTHEGKDRYDERFHRMWRYYLLICAGGFRSRSSQLWQIVMTRSGTPQPACRFS